MAIDNTDILERLQRARRPKEKKLPGGKKPKKEPGEAEEMTLTEWFQEGDRMSTGKCRHCGGKSCKGDPLYYKHSQAHILPKRLFPSIATHPDNRIELCFWSNNCHANYDNGMLDIIDMHCFDEIIEKFVRMYPTIDKKERRHIPDALLQYAKDSI